MIDSSRRDFLSAVGAVWGLSRSEELQLHSIEVPHVELGEDEFPSEVQVGEFDGALIAEDYKDVEVNVSNYPHQRSVPVAVELQTGSMKMSAALEVEEARELAKEIERAAASTKRWRQINSDDSE